MLLRDWWRGGSAAPGEQGPRGMTGMSDSQTPNEIGGLTMLAVLFVVIAILLVTGGGRGYRRLGRRGV